MLYEERTIFDICGLLCEERLYLLQWTFWFLPRLQIFYSYIQILLQIFAHFRYAYYRVILVITRVVDPYLFFPDPDPDPEFDVADQYGSGSNTDPGL